MASKYHQKFPIPEGFPEILDAFAMEILRDQPLDIIAYSAEYFKHQDLGEPFDYPLKGASIPPPRAKDKQLKPIRQGTKGVKRVEEEVIPLEKVEEESLKDLLERKEWLRKEISNVTTIIGSPQEKMSKDVDQIFDHFDTNNNGVMERSELTEFFDYLFPLVHEQFRKEEMERMILMADKNKNDVIEKDEMFDIVNEFYTQLLYAYQEELDILEGQRDTRDSFEMAKERKAFLEQEISILEGALLNKEKLIAEVGDVFEQFDQNKNGVLEPDEIIDWFTYLHKALEFPTFSKNEMIKLVEHAGSNSNDVIRKEQALILIQDVFKLTILKFKSELYGVDSTMDITDAMADASKMNVTVERRDFIEEQISQLQGFLLNQDELRKEVMSYFRQFDVNKNNLLEKEELESWFLFLYDELNIPKFSELEQAELVRDANQSKNPALNKEEMFILVTKVFEITIQKYIEELEGKSMFKEESKISFERKQFIEEVIQKLTEIKMNPKKLREGSEIIFDEFDTNKNGILEKEERDNFFAFMYEKIGFPEFSRKQMFVILAAADQNKNNLIEKDEMIYLIEKVLDMTIEMYYQELGISPEEMTKDSIIETDRKNHEDSVDEYKALLEKQIEVMQNLIENKQQLKDESAQLLELFDPQNTGGLKFDQLTDMFNYLFSQLNFPECSDEEIKELIRIADIDGNKIIEKEELPVLMQEMMKLFLQKKIEELTNL